MIDIDNWMRELEEEEDIEIKNNEEYQTKLFEEYVARSFLLVEKCPRPRNSGIFFRGKAILIKQYLLLSLIHILSIAAYKPFFSLVLMMRSFSDALGSVLKS